MPQVIDHLSESALGQRVEHEDYQRLRREGKRRGVSPQGFNRLALHALLRELANVVFRNRVELRQKLYADDSPERIFRRHQQRTTLSRADVNEGELAVVNAKAVQHLLKQIRLDGLVRRIQQANEPCFPADIGARGVN